MIVLKSWIREWMSFWVFLKYKDIWNLYEYLKKTQKKSGLCASVYSHYLDKHGSFIGLGASFANRPCTPHGILGIFVSEDAQIGKDAVIFQQVTIGSVYSNASKHQGAPFIGDNCYIGAGAKIIGNVHIGNNCRIGANAVVYEDMPDNSVALCSPTQIREYESAPDNHFYVTRADGHKEYWENGGFHRVK